MNKNLSITLLFLSALLALKTLEAQQNNAHLRDSLYNSSSFQPGEYLQYKVKYGFISGGIAEMKIDLVPIGYDWYYHVTAVAKTSGAVSMLANVYDKYESYIDITNGLPIKAIRNIREGSYTRYNEVLFRRWENKVMSLRSGTHKVPPNTLDILSAFYYARKFIFSKGFKKNQIIKLTTYFDDKLYDVKIRYKETEKKRTNFGRIRCLRFVSVLDKESPFEKEDDLEVWFSDDGNYVPVRIRMDMPVSSVKCDLTNFKNLKNPFGVPTEKQKKEKEKNK